MNGNHEPEIPPVKPVALITLSEAARRLAVSPKWLRARSATLPFMRLLGPRTFRVDVAALEKWVERQRPHS